MVVSVISFLTYMDLLDELFLQKSSAAFLKSRWLYFLSQKQDIDENVSAKASQCSLHSALAENDEAWPKWCRWRQMRIEEFWRIMPLSMKRSRVLQCH